MGNDFEDFCLHRFSALGHSIFRTRRSRQLFGIIAQVLRGVAQTVETFRFVSGRMPRLLVDGPGCELGGPTSLEEGGDAAAEEL